MEYKFYQDFLENQESLEVQERDLVWLLDEDDLENDYWFDLRLKNGKTKYKINIGQDHSPKNGNSNYEIKITKKEPLKIEDGYPSKWRKVREENYESINSVGFEIELKKVLEEELPVNFNQQQNTL